MASLSGTLQIRNVSKLVAKVLKTANIDPNIGSFKLCAIVLKLLVLHVLFFYYQEFTGRMASDLEEYL